MPHVIWSSGSNTDRPAPVLREGTCGSLGAGSDRPGSGCRWGSGVPQELSVDPGAVCTGRLEVVR